MPNPALFLAVGLVPLAALSILTTPLVALRMYQLTRRHWPHPRWIWSICTLGAESLYLGLSAFTVWLLLKSYGHPLLSALHPQASARTWWVGLALFWPGYVICVVSYVRVYQPARRRYGFPVQDLHHDPDGSELQEPPSRS